MLTQLFQPSCHVVVRNAFANVVYEQCTNSTTIVCRCDSTITLLTRSVLLNVTVGPMASALEIVPIYEASASGAMGRM
jgi:hypothetical protein